MDYIKAKCPNLESEEALKYLIRLYTYDNMYYNLNNALAKCELSKARNYCCAVAKGLKNYGKKLSIKAP